MGENSAIEWTGDTWNPVTGCTKVSPACANCYIERQTPLRIAGRKFVKGHIPLEFHANRLDVPLRRRKPTTYFVNSMSDLFHEDVPEAFIDRVMLTIVRSPYHTFQVLTKRAARMRDYFSAPNLRDRIDRLGLINKPLVTSRGKLRPTLVREWPLPTLWLGVSVENQHFADERIPLLLQTPAAVRFLSCEPLVGKVLIDNGTHSYFTCRSSMTEDEADEKERRGEEFYCCDSFMEHGEHYQGLDWVIAGGESGPRVRPSDPDWFRSLRDQCNAAGVPFFFKQWGGRTPKSGGRVLDGRTWDEMPEAR